MQQAVHRAELQRAAAEGERRGRLRERDDQQMLQRRQKIAQRCFFTWEEILLLKPDSINGEEWELAHYYFEATERQQQFSESMKRKSAQSLRDLNEKKGATGKALLWGEEIKH